MSDSDDWISNAECKGQPIDLFFPSASSRSRKRIDRALEMCERCMVKVQCGEFAFRHEVSDGIWAGVFLTDRTVFSREMIPSE